MESGRASIPYVPFKTFLTALDALERGLPNQLDRSLWPSYSGAIQGQLLAAFRYLGLIDQNNAPSEALRGLVSKREERRARLRELVEARYRGLVALDLSRTSPKQLDEAMREYGLSGATHRKAVSFFLQAAQYGGLPISPLLKAKTRTAAFGHRRTAAEPAAQAPLPAMSKTVRLKTGGTVTVTAAIDLFSLGAEDRAFVLDLIDRLQRYGAPAE